MRRRAGRRPLRRARSAAKIAARAALCLLTAACASCTPGDQLQTHIAALDDATRREQAVEAIVAAVMRASPLTRPALQERAVDALSSAYRDDSRRELIVAALAALNDARAADVLLAAVADGYRGGAYHVASLTAARALGRLRLPHTVPRLLAILRDTTPSPRFDQFIEHRQAIVAAFETMRAEQTVPELIALLEAPPLRQPLALNRAAARALGTLEARAAITPLLRAMGSSPHRLLLHDTARAALCQIGPAAAPELRHIARGKASAAREVMSTAAVQVLGDVGQPLEVEGQARDRSAGYRLALAESALRHADHGAAAALLSGLASDDKVDVALRLAAADLIGWYGCDQRSAGTLLALGGAPATPRLLRAAATRALGRCAMPVAPRQPASAAAALTAWQVTALLRDQPASSAIALRARFAATARCGARLDCYRQLLADDHDDWRAAERAALELGRRGDAPGAETLARGYAKAHPSVRQAILVALERLLALPAIARGPVADLLSKALESAPSLPAVETRARCVVARLRRTGA